MSASGSGRWALDDPASEPLDNPREVAEQVLTELVASEQGAKHLLRGLDRRGLTVCWKAPTDD